MKTTRKPYPSDVSDAEWEFLAPYRTLMREDAPPRDHSRRRVFDAVRYVVRTGCPWDFLPHDFPPASAVYQQARRWVAAGAFEAIAHDLRMILRLVAKREAQPTAAILDGRTLQSTPESGGRAGYDGAKKKNGSKVHIAVDTLGHLLALMVTAADEQERAQVADLTARLQEVTGGTVEVAFVDQGYSGDLRRHGRKPGMIRTLIDHVAPRMFGDFFPDVQVLRDGEPFAVSTTGTCGSVG